MRIFRKTQGLKHARVTVAFDGTAGNGAVGTVTVFTITGRVYVDRLTAFCTEDLTEAAATATLQCGVAADTDAFIVTTTATDIDANDWWNTNVPAPGAVSILGTPSSGATSSQVRKLISTDVILTVGAQNVTNGTIVFDVFYLPVTDNGLLT